MTDDGVARAIAILRRGGVVAIRPKPSTVSRGADLENPDAIARVYAIKGRPVDHPLIVHAHGARGAGRV